MMFRQLILKIKLFFFNIYLLLFSLFSGFLHSSNFFLSVLVRVLFPLFLLLLLYASFIAGDYGEAMFHASKAKSQITPFFFHFFDLTRDYDFYPEYSIYKLSSSDFFRNYYSAQSHLFEELSAKSIQYHADEIPSFLEEFLDLIFEHDSDLNDELTHPSVVHFGSYGLPYDEWRRPVIDPYTGRRPYAFYEKTKLVYFFPVDLIERGVREDIITLFNEELCSDINDELYVFKTINSGYIFDYGYSDLLHNSSSKSIRVDYPPRLSSLQSSDFSVKSGFYYDDTSELELSLRKLRRKRRIPLPTNNIGRYNIENNFFSTINMFSKDLKGINISPPDDLSIYDY